MGRTIGYARVSTTGQTTAPQVAELEAAGCDRIFHEKVSTRVSEENRIQLQAALAVLEEGDELVVAKLDRLGRTMVEVINRLDDLQNKGTRQNGTTSSGTTNRTGRGRTGTDPGTDKGVHRAPQEDRRELGGETTIGTAKKGQHHPTPGGRTLPTQNPNPDRSIPIGRPTGLCRAFKNRISPLDT
jgi:hypothetical protein